VPTPRQCGRFQKHPLNKANDNEQEKFS
jgi:hypothetical protein